MKSNVIWQRCPKCGQWCKAETGTLANFAKGIMDVGSEGKKIGIAIGRKVNEYVGGKLGKKGEDISGQAVEWISGMSLGILNGAKEGVFNDSYVFECKCGNFWSISDSNEKQNAEYSAELAREFLNLSFLQRKHLYICDELGLIPSSFRVLTKDNLPSGIIFPTGHPINDTLYVCHPYRHNYYLPYDSCEIELLRDELREFKRIMKKLGAKHIDYSDIFKHDEAKKKTTSKTYKGGVEDLKYSAQGSRESDLKNEVEKGIQSELEESWDGLLTEEKPKLPDNLIWYNHREDWKDECESRLEGRTIHYSFSISVSSFEMTNEQEREKINAELKILRSTSVNGSFISNKSLSLKRKTEMTWKVNVDFYPLSDYERKVIAQNEFESKNQSWIDKFKIF